jgi:putrescine aminotransferase
LSGLYSVDDSLKLERKEINELYKEHVNPGLAGMLSLLNFDKHFVKAKGVKVWDSEGKEYLDFLGGYGALNLGHNNDQVIEGIKKVIGLPNILQASIGTMAAVLGANLAKITPGNLNKSFFCNSGAEAVEGALKLARAATQRTRFIYCSNSFHGKSFGALSVTGREKYQNPFKPLLSNCTSVPFGEITPLEKELNSKDVAAFIVEPIQGEGGIIVPPHGYLKKAKEICEKYGTLMILDEIQTGFGRTGKMFALEHEDVVPDILCLAKSLGGGIMPIGAIITNDRIWDKAYGGLDKALLHTSTFGGNTLAAAAGIAAINEFVSKDLAKEAAEKGNYLFSKLKDFKNKYPMVKEVRGRGLMIGIEFEKPSAGILDKITRGAVTRLSTEYLGSLVAGELLNNYGIITAYTLNNPNVIRLEPPLIVSYEELNRLVDALNDIFTKRNGFVSMALSGGKTIVNTLFNKK